MYQELKDIATNLNILDWCDDSTECLSVKIDLYKGKFGSILVAFDCKFNNYTLKQTITDDQYCAIFALGYDEIFAYKDSIEKMNFCKNTFTIEGIIKELKECIDTINADTNHDLERLDSGCYTFVNQVTNLMKE